MKGGGGRKGSPGPSPKGEWEGPGDSYERGYPRPFLPPVERGGTRGRNYEWRLTQAPTSTKERGRTRGPTIMKGANLVQN